MDVSTGGAGVCSKYNADAKRNNDNYNALLPPKTRGIGKQTENARRQGHWAEHPMPVLSPRLAVQAASKNFLSPQDGEGVNVNIKITRNTATKGIRSSAQPDRPRFLCAGLSNTNVLVSYHADR